MKKIILKAFNDGNIQVRYDQNLNLYAINIINPKGENESHLELTQERALELLDQHTNADIEPLLTVIQKAISLNIDPASIMNMGVN
tara:strand:- start:560 stop:817 length:258 start_codon:yes stop_codon:yes gene_type:complete